MAMNELVNKSASPLIFYPFLSHGNECQSDDGVGIITLGRRSYKGQAFKPREA